MRTPKWDDGLDASQSSQPRVQTPPQRPDAGFFQGPLPQLQASHAPGSAPCRRPQGSAGRLALWELALVKDLRSRPRRCSDALALARDRSRRAHRSCGWRGLQGLGLVHAGTPKQAHTALRLSDLVEAVACSDFPSRRPRRQRDQGNGAPFPLAQTLPWLLTTLAVVSPPTLCSGQRS